MRVAWTRSPIRRVPPKSPTSLAPKHHHITIISCERPQELRARLAREDAEAAHQRRKDLILFGAAILGVGVIAGLCLWTIAQSSSTADDRKWATSIVSSIVAGAVGYLFGRSSK